MKKTMVLVMYLFIFMPAAQAAAMSADEFLQLCREGTYQQIEAAIKQGADVNAKSASGRTPLMMAAGNSAEVFNALIRAGADVNAKDNYGETPLISAAWRNNDPEAINILIRAGANVNAKGEYGFTPLMQAARYGDNPEVLNALIRAGADVNAKGDTGLTALMLAVIDYGGRSDYTFRKNNLEFVKMLIQAGTDVNAKDNNGRTALSVAVEENPEEDREVDAYRSGVELPLDTAAKKNKPEIISLLLVSGATVSENDARLAGQNEYLKNTGIVEKMKR